MRLANSVRLSSALTFALATGLGTLQTPALAQTLRGDVEVDGSSTVAPISSAVAEEFRNEQPGVRVTVGVSGTGGGFKRFVIGEIDISDASRPITAKEYDAAMQNNIDFIELPVAYDGLSIVVNKENTWCKSLTIDQLRRIYIEGSTIKSWKDLDPTYPDVPIRLFGPGHDSGTFDYFKEVVIGKEGNVRPDMSPSEDDNVLVTGVAGDKGAIGFFGCAYYFENTDKLNVVAIDNGNGSVAPTAQTIENGTYPLSRPLFIYINARSARKPHVRAFVNFYLQHVPNLAQEVGYVRLPDVIYERAVRNFRENKTGTQFLDENGEKVQGPVVDVYQ